MLTVALTLASCRPACDRVALLAVTEALEREIDAPGAEVRALNGIATACPSLHRGLIDTLRTHYEPVGRTSSMTRYGDGFLAAKNAACDDPQRWVEESSRVTFDRRPQIFYDACGLSRLGVLDEGERLLQGDDDFFFMLAALNRSGVDRGLVRRLGRGLLNSVAPLPVAHRRCTENDDGIACLRLLDVAGLEPIPLGGGPSTYSGRHALRLLVSPEAIFWDGEMIARLDHGALHPADVDHHRILPLMPIVEAWAKSLRDAESDDDTRSHLEIAIDRRLPMGIATDVLYTVTKAGLSNIALIGGAHTSLTTTPIWVPDRWTLSNPDWIAGPIIIDDAGVHAALPSGDAKTVPVDATAAIGAIAQEFRASGYNRVLVRAAPSIRADVVVPVLSVLRGSECLHYLVYEPRGDGCLRPTFDSEPPLPGW